MILVGLCIVIGSVFISRHLAQKIAGDEKKKIEQWVEAVKEVTNPGSTTGILNSKVLTENNADIPMIVVTEKDSILDHYNVDTAARRNKTGYLQQKLIEYKKLHAPIVWNNPLMPGQNNRVYYGQSDLQIQIKYLPLVQLFVVALFIFILFYAVHTRNKSTQNQVWAGMAKETAHQLGTPLSSLQGWVEMLKAEDENNKVAKEMSKDVDRLKLVSDRFSKIGSIPQLEAVELKPQIESMVDYIRRRASSSVKFSMNIPDDVEANINAPLFDWVIENLLKNALDAMDGKGSIDVQVINDKAAVYIDVKDSGKGILKKNIGNVFKPGFTTKKRGWGLGLSLSKRIIKTYHKGSLFVKDSEPGVGTTFRIALSK